MATGRLRDRVLDLAASARILIYLISRAAIDFSVLHVDLRQGQNL